MHAALVLCSAATHITSQGLTQTKHMQVQPSPELTGRRCTSINGHMSFAGEFAETATCHNKLLQPRAEDSAQATEGRGPSSSCGWLATAPAPSSPQHCVTDQRSGGNHPLVNPIPILASPCTRHPPCNCMGCRQAQDEGSWTLQLHPKYHSQGWD